MRVPRSQNAEPNPPQGPTHSTKLAGVVLHPRRLLLGIARQSGIGDPDSCKIILSILSASRAVRHALNREMDHELGFRDNAGYRLATLITLYALSPLPASVADLAYHAEVSRSSMTGLIEALERHGLVERRTAGRRITQYGLTQPGQEASVRAVHRFLQLASKLAGGIGSPNGNATVKTCEQIESCAEVP
jgi:DNA-binding MarR family transcriptional regulator